MKIALLGYGKMGKVIEQIAMARGHEIVFKKTSTNGFENLWKADVAIDFSLPSAAVCNISNCFDTNIPVVCGTTGWLENYDKMTTLCIQKNGAMICSSNFSLGVNLFFELNEYLAKIMSQFEQYQPKIEEIHHLQKLDAPSGTAISLANEILKNTRLKYWSLENNHPNSIFIDAKRIENVAGTHTVCYESTVDTIEIKHTAHNRNGFALGAVIAAEWIVGKKGVFLMKDVLENNFKST